MNDTDMLQAGLLRDKVAIVVGASQGIGAAIARSFAAAGARVVLAARSEPELVTLAAEIGDGRALAAPADVLDEESLRALVERTLSEFGRLDAAVNNAAAANPRQVPLADIATEDFDAAVAVNLRGVFLSMKYEIPAMLATGGGAIVNMASTAGLRGVPGIAAYVGTKHGVIGLTKTAALDYAAHAIRVNVITPGPIENDRIAALREAQRRPIAEAVPLGRIGRPGEVAALATWLCSDLASFITGASIPIDGGQLAGPESAILDRMRNR